MKYLILLCGYSFSGKSTLAKKLKEDLSNCEVISLDQINEERGFDISGEIPLDEWEHTHLMVVDRIKTSTHNYVIVDDTNMFKRHRDRFAQAGEDSGFTALVVHINTSPEEVKSRYKNSESLDRHVPPLIAFNYVIDNFEKPDQNENFFSYNGEQDYTNLLKTITN